MTPNRDYEVQVTLTAEIEASDSATAAAEVLRELRLRLPECTLVVTVVKKLAEGK